MRLPCLAWPAPSVPVKAAGSPQRAGREAATDDDDDERGFGDEQGRDALGRNAD